MHMHTSFMCFVTHIASSEGELMLSILHDPYFAHMRRFLFRLLIKEHTNGLYDLMATIHNKLNKGDT